MCRIRNNNNNTIMKKIIASFVAAIVAAGSMFAQDLAQITEIYNSGAAALSSGDKTGALQSFEQAYELATALGEEGQEVVANCKNIIPELNLSIAKDLVKSANYDEAVAKLNSTIEIAANFGNEEVAEEARNLIPQVIMQQGGSLLNNKDYEGAAAAYRKVLEGDPDNGTASLRLGLALNALGDIEGAKAALETAAANGQEATANKQLANINLKEAAAALKAKDYTKAVEAALKTCEYGDNSQAYQIAGQASQLAGKDSDAIKYFEKYLELYPTAKNAGQIAFTVGALYQKAKNNAKAKEYYSMAADDPKYGADAKKLLEALK